MPTIREIYLQYQIPPQLQRHMLEVAAVGELIREVWYGPEVNWEILKPTLLIHDMGNIVKFKTPFLGEMAANQDHWLQVQQEFIEKYGHDPHQVTMKIARELHLDKQILNLLETSSYLFTDQYGYQSWEVRIFDYCDMCVSPAGIVGIEARVADYMQRYNLPGQEKSMQLWRQNAEIVEQYLADELNFAEVRTPDQETKVASLIAQLKSFRL